jgi:hypothetical protein
MGTQAVEQTPWAAVGLTQAEWNDAFEIPEFLQRKAEPKVEAPVPQPMPTKKYREELETSIKVEADKRWRNWMPTKTDRTRPRKSTYIKQVRAEFTK